MRLSSKLMASAAFATLSLSVGATAQETDTDENLVQDTVVVTGVRGQNRDIIDTKRNTDGVADFLTSDDIGKLPDFNIADAIRRIAGVNTIFDEDEGQFVALRGLSADFTHTEFDGGSVAAVDLGGFFGDGRRVLLEAVPAGAVKSVEAYKTESARLDGQGIGGQLNLVTRSAFDTDGMFFTATGVLGLYTDQNAPEVDKIGHADSNEQDEPSYRTEFTYSNTFGQNDEFGIVLAGFNNRKKRDQERLIPGIVPRFYDSTGALVSIDAPGATHLGGVYPRAGYSNEVQRWGGLAKFEYRGEDVDASFRAIYNQQDESERTDQGTLITFFPPPTGVTNGAIQFPNTGMNLRSQMWDVEKSLLHLAGDVDKQWNEDNTTSFQLVYSEAGYSEVKPRIEIRGFTTGPVDITQSGSTTFSNPQSFFLDPANYAGGNLNASNLDLTDDSSELTELSVDHAFNADSGDEGLGVMVGARYRTIDRQFDRTFYDFDGTTAGNTDVGRFLIPGLSYTPRLSNVGYPIIDITSFDFNSAVAGTNSDLSLVSTSTALTPGNGSFAVEEDVFALYGQVQHRAERYLIEGGLRYESTDTTATALDTTGATAALVNRDGSYDNFLPSINFQYEITDNLILKAGASRSIARPGHAALSGAISSTVDAGGVTTTTQGNPDLKPRLSDNFDIALEKYFDDGDGLVSVSLFHKEIQDEIFGRTTLQPNGDRIIRPENAENASVTGVEFNLIKNQLDFLPGILSNLGFSGNVSFFDGETVLDETETLDFLVEQPEYIVNASLFYVQGPFEARATFNQTDSYLAFGQPTNDFGWREDTRQFLDFQAQYDFNDRFQVFGEVRNALNEAEESFFGPNEEFLADSSTFGRAFWLGLTYTH